MPVVLVYNEEKATTEWEWDDIAGVRHHFPNVYKGMVRPGEQFIYYRGTRRLNGKRGDIEFFGHGLIGDVWLDERSREAAAVERNWFCSIEDYRPFARTVSAREGNGYLEGIPKNRLQNIRRLPISIYDTILFRAFGDATPAHSTAGQPNQESQFAEDPSTIFLPRREAQLDGNLPTGGYPPRSARAKLIGDGAELLVMAWLLDGHAGPLRELRHVAKVGEKPGWDIEYRAASGRLQRVEVKGTTLNAFANVEFTANELAAARVYKDDYWLYLVALCESNAPKITRIRNPAASLLAEPVVYRMWNVAEQR